MAKINIETPEEKTQETPQASAANESIETPAAEPEVLTAQEPVNELEAAKQEAAENHDRLMRLAAEFENYKKRAAKDREDYHKYANESFIKSLLPVIDYLEMGLAAAKNSQCADQNLLQGFEMMAAEFYKVLEKAHVEVIDPEIGCDFDPNFQECVMQQETDEYAPNKVCSVYQKGYKLYDRLLRPARVVTSKCK